MTLSLIPCGDCERHVRVIENACPFCGAEVSAVTIRNPLSTGARLGRAAMFTVGAAMLAVAGCGDDGGTPDALPPMMDAAPPDGGVAPAYGTPAPDAGPPDASPADASPADADPDDGGAMALYGSPPPDSGSA